MTIFKSPSLEPEPLMPVKALRAVMTDHQYRKARALIRQYPAQYSTCKVNGELHIHAEFARQFVRAPEQGRIDIILKMCWTPQLSRSLSDMVAKTSSQKGVWSLFFTGNKGDFQRAGCCVKTVESFVQLRPKYRFFRQQCEKLKRAFSDPFSFNMFEKGLLGVKRRVDEFVTCKHQDLALKGFDDVAWDTFYEFLLDSALYGHPLEKAFEFACTRREYNLGQSRKEVHVTEEGDRLGGVDTLYASGNAESYEEAGYQQIEVGQLLEELLLGEDEIDKQAFFLYTFERLLWKEVAKKLGRYTSENYRIRYNNLKARMKERAKELGLDF